jgi:hypothetical protein
VQGETPVVEALFDNDTLAELQDAIRNLAWQPSADYYSLRRFFVLQSRALEASS